MLSRLVRATPRSRSRPLLRTFISTSTPLEMDAVKSDPSLPTSAAKDAGAQDHTTPSSQKIQVTSHNQYKTPRLLREDISPDPMKQFQHWLSSALNPKEGQPEVHEPEAMTICTSLPSGVPSARVVLLKQADDTGFVFYTNYSSRKSRELQNNPYASIAIYWRELSRSIRVVGKAEKVTREESIEYFNSRPRGSQLGAWASRQSEVLEDEGVLEERVKKIEKKFEGRAVECPEFWGGWRVVPLQVHLDPLPVPYPLSSNASSARSNSGQASRQGYTTASVILDRKDQVPRCLGR